MLPYLDEDHVKSGSVMIGRYVPSTGTLYPMTAKNKFAFVEKLNSGFLFSDMDAWKKYGKYGGNVAYWDYSVNYGTVILIGEVYGDTFVIPLRGWKVDPFTQEALEASALK